VKIIPVNQGTPEWLALRAKHHTASEAPAVMGASKYLSRSDLMKQKATGITEEVNGAKQALFDRGHAAENGARTILEEILGEALYPVTVVCEETNLLASLDGLTMMGDVVFECKLWNEGLAKQVQEGELDPHYYWQLEQQLLVAQAEKVIFVTSDGTRDKFASMEYCAVPGRAEQLIAAWHQFSADLETYKPVAEEVKPIGRTPETLPALHIEVTGMVTASNLAEYKAHALAVFAGINRELVTDAQFADAEKTVAWCKDIESRLAAAKQHALSQTASIDDLFRTIDDISAEARTTRLELDKLVSSRKDTIRAEAVLDGRNALDDHIATLNQRIGRALMPQVAHDFAGVIKGKRSVKSMADAISAELARTKIAANELADKITLNLRAINDQADFGFLFSDVATLVLKEPEFVAMSVKNRISEHMAKEAARVEAERAQIAEQERAKAQATERARADAEIAAATAKARAEAHAQAQADADAKRAIDEVIAKAREQDYMAKIDASRMMHNASGQPPVATMKQAPVCEIAQTEDTSETTSPLSPPTLRLGQICERLGFNLTADFMRRLGFEPAATDKASKLFHENDFPRMCAALVRHIQQVSQGVAA